MKIHTLIPLLALMGLSACQTTAPERCDKPVFEVPPGESPLTVCPSCRHLINDRNILRAEINSFNKIKVIKRKAGPSWKPFQHLPASSNIIKQFTLKADKWKCFQNFKIKPETALLSASLRTNGQTKYRLIEALHKSAKEPTYIRIAICSRAKYARDSMTQMYEYSAFSNRPWDVITDIYGGAIGDCLLGRSNVTTTEMEPPLRGAGVSFVRNNIHITIYGGAFGSFYTIARELDKRIKESPRAYSGFRKPGNIKSLLEK